MTNEKIKNITEFIRTQSEGLNLLGIFSDGKELSVACKGDEDAITSALFQLMHKEEVVKGIILSAARAYMKEILPAVSDGVSKGVSAEINKRFKKKLS